MVEGDIRVMKARSFARVLQGSAGRTCPAWTGTGCPKLAVLVLF